MMRMTTLSTFPTPSQGQASPAAIPPAGEASTQRLAYLFRRSLKSGHLHPLHQALMQYRKIQST